MTTVAIMQPTYLPWLGYFDLMDQVDEMILLDSVQFSYQSWQHRNRIVSPSGSLQWLTIPVRKEGRIHKRLDEIELGEKPFADEHLRRLETSYGSAAFASALSPITQLLAECAGSSHRLCEVTVPILVALSETLGVATPITRSSELGAEGRRSDLLVALCVLRGADRYVTPPGSLSYLDDDHPVFDKAGIEVVVQHYEHPHYSQHHGDPFVPFASVVDLLANAGPGSLDVIRSGHRPPRSIESARLEESPHGG